MKIIIGMFLGLILISSVFASNVNAFADWSKWTSVPKEPTMVKDIKSKSDVKKSKVTKKDTEQKTADTNNSDHSYCDKSGDPDILEDLVWDHYYLVNSVNIGTNMYSKEEARDEFLQYPDGTKLTTLDNLIHSTQCLRDNGVLDRLKEIGGKESKVNGSIIEGLKEAYAINPDKIRAMIPHYSSKILDMVSNGDSGNFTDCGVWEDIYRSKVGGVNNDFELRFGEKEVSQRIADHATSGGGITEDIMRMNEMAANILGNCGTTYDVLGEVHGKLNQNIIDSLKMYKNMSIKDVGSSNKESKSQTKSSAEVKKDAKKDTKKKTTDTKKKTKEVKKTVKSEAKKKVEKKASKKNKSPLEECSDSENIYMKSVRVVNDAVSDRFGGELSQRVADHVTSDGTITNSIVTANKASEKLIASCNYHSEDAVRKSLGGFNYNIIDSVQIYKDMRIQDIR